MIPRLPEEVLGDILSRLPVKSLLRFKSVSKSWHSLINSCWFVKLHRNRSIDSNADLSVLALSKHSSIIGFDSLDRLLQSGNLNLHRSTRAWEGRVDFHGSCHGLFCFTCIGSEPKSPNVVILWNPATGESRELPIYMSSMMTKMLSSTWDFISYGFGHDSTNDDYKVVRFLLPINYGTYGRYFHNEVDVYSMKSNSWHSTIVDCPETSHARVFPVLCNGALHLSMSGSGIDAFHLSSERFVLVPPPPVNSTPMLKNLGGSLSLFSYYSDCENQSHVDIWVMKEYGVKESWTKLFTITGRELGIPLGPIPLIITPFSCSKNGVGILYERSGGRRSWYDVGTKTIKKIYVKGVKGYCHSVVYKESLVALNVGGGARRERKGHIKAQQCKRRTRRKLS